MMKYIRNKKGKIFKRHSVVYPNGEQDTWYVNHNYSLYYNSQQHLIEKEADTIEELCDEFVCGETFIDEEDEAQFLASVGENVYGAIWTEWGLKYVAKMNKKGELELL